MNVKSSGRILMTGAGFTHNIGTPLARDMWYEIFNNPKIQSEPQIRQLLVSDTDFESVYNLVIGGSYSASEKEAISKAVIEAYENVDSTIREWKFNPSGQHQLNIYELQKLINRFAGSNAQGFYFTLNQDLFLERQYYNGTPPHLPGIRNKSNWFKTNFNSKLKSEDLCQLPDLDELNAQKYHFLAAHRFFYVKLHGSYNWLSSTGNQKLVIGRNKLNQIGQEPLLSYYFDLFKEVLSHQDQRLLVVGYGFGDEHINEVLADSVENFGLKIHIISPVSQLDFMKALQSAHRGNSILNGLSGYFNKRLNDIFPSDQSETQEKRTLYKNFFAL